MTLTIAALVALASATVTVDGPVLLVIAAAMLISIVANVYLIVHVRRVEVRLARVLGEVDALRAMLDLTRRDRRATDTAQPNTTEAPDGDAP